MVPVPRKMKAAEKALKKRAIHDQRLNKIKGKEQAEAKFQEKKRESELLEKDLKENGEDPAKKKKLEEINTQIKSMNDEVAVIEQDLMQIDNEEGDIDAMEDIIKEEPGPDVPLTSIENANHSGGTAEDPVVVSDEDVPILTASTQHEREHGAGRTVIAFGGAGRVQQAVVRYGPKSHAKYRMEAYMGELCDDDFTDPQKRRGEQHQYVGRQKVYTFTSANVESMLGVALPGNCKKHADPLDCVDPNMKNKAFEPIRVVIKWKDGVISTETRTVARRIWPNHQPGATDKAIQMGAGVQEARHEKWRRNQVTGEDRTPTPDPQVTAALAQRSPPPGLTASPGSTPSPERLTTPAGAAQGSNSQPAGAKAAPQGKLKTPSREEAQKWKMAWAMVEEKDLDNLTPDDKKSLMIYVKGELDKL